MKKKRIGGIFGGVVIFLLMAPTIGCKEETTPADALQDPIQEMPQDMPGEETLLPPQCMEEFDPLNPELRMVFFDLLSPERLNNEVLENLMKTGFSTGDFIWLLKFSNVDDGRTDTDGVMHLHTGAGEAVGEFGVTNCFDWLGDPRWPDVEANVSISGNDISWPAAEPKIDITVPIFKTDPATGQKNFLLQLPLKDVIISSGAFSADRRSIGTLSACSEDAKGGVLDGIITVEDAKEVVIAEMGLTLCGLLSGDRGSNLNDPADDCQRPMAQWPEGPDTEDANGSPAYRMRACFSAVQAVIVE